MYVVGFDPGGAAAFGWTVAEFNGDAFQICATGICNNAADAVEAAAHSLPQRPAAIGVDAPLYWVPVGDRKADTLVRRMVCAIGGQPGTVGHVNSLRGACLVQGVLCAHRAALRWPDALVTEAHPKALLRVSGTAAAVAGSMASAFRSEHEQDAFLAAYAAGMLVDRNPAWHDLVKVEQECFFPGGSRVAYWFPVSQTFRSP